MGETTNTNSGRQESGVLVDKVEIKNSNQGSHDSLMFVPLMIHRQGIGRAQKKC